VTIVVLLHDFGFLRSISVFKPKHVGRHDRFQEKCVTFCRKTTTIPQLKIRILIQSLRVTRS
jgi:hypothetical protein